MSLRQTNLCMVRQIANMFAARCYGEAITHPSFELCSAPCKARRFAPPTRVSARGLRALTAPPPQRAGIRASGTPGPARSSPDCNCVMATPCVSSRSQATPVSGNRSRMRSIGSEAKRPRRLSRPGVNTLVHRHRPRFERGRERRTSLPIPSPWSRTSDRRTASGPALMPASGGIRSRAQSIVGDPSGLRDRGSNQQPVFA